MFSRALRSLRPELLKPAIFPRPFATSPFSHPEIATVTFNPVHASVYTSVDRPVPLTPHSPAIVKILGSDAETDLDPQTYLEEQLKSIPTDTKYLRIDDNTPSDENWACLGSHFSSVENLEIDSGFHETLNDKLIPPQWPLQRLEIRSTCGEVVQSSFVRQGRVQHLSLLLTAGLRFMGPTTNDMLGVHKEEVKRGETNAEYVTLNEGLSEEKKVEFVSIPEMVGRYMNRYYGGSDWKLDPENEPPAGGTQTHTLEIFENDAIDTFCRMAMALPHLVDNLQTLRIRSTSGLDFQYLDEGPFRYILPTLQNLKILNLTVGEVFEDATYLPTLYKVLPPNLTTLFFRGPASLCQSGHWSDWLRAFESREFLPHLQHLAFVLDLHYTEEKGKWGRRLLCPAPAGLLYQARVACEHLYGSVRRRGVQIVNIPPEHATELDLFTPVDDRW